MHKLKPGKIEYVYIISNGIGQYKIGHSNNPQARLKQLQTGNPQKLKLIHLIKCVTYPAAYLEKRILHWFRWQKIKGEWRSLTQSDLDYLTNINQDNLLW